MNEWITLMAGTLFGWTLAIIFANLMPYDLVRRIIANDRIIDKLKSRESRINDIRRALGDLE